MHRLLAALFVLLAVSAAHAAPKAELYFPLGRTAYQTNEWIDVCVLRSDTEPLKAGDLVLNLTGADGSKLGFTFAVKAAAIEDKAAQVTEHLHLNGYLLRPGKYTLDAAVDGTTAAVALEVLSHLRKSDFRLINWGRATGKDQLVQGEDSLGFNLFYGHYGRESDDASFLRAGVDYVSNCTMSGAHQMDIRSECDWSDPYVTRGGTVRVVRQALQDRTRGNVPGVHFYDEPGLTWVKHSETGENTPHMIPAQVRAYIAAFGVAPLQYHKVDPKNPEDVARWRHWAKWKLSFMDAAWKEAQFGVSQVRPDFLSLTQSQYGWSAFTDGYYFNVVRSLPVTSGHGGYDDYGLGFFNPSYTLEMARARDFTKPCWYLPTWYGNTPSDRFRMEQYLSFQTGIQGMMSPPDLEPATNPTGRQGIVESNHLMQRLGPIFNTMSVTRPPVALLSSLSQAIHTQTKDMQANYLHAIPHGQNLPLAYLAGKLLQHQFLAVVEEDVLEGTLAANHKAIILTSLDYLDDDVIAALEDFAKQGGLVLMTGDCTVNVKGAVKLGVKPSMPDQETIDKLMKEKKYGELGPYTTVGKQIQGATPLAKAIATELEKVGIKPPLASDKATLAVTRQAAGDVEYLFVVNATPDTSDPKERNGILNASAKLTLPDARPIYDAVRGGKVAELTEAGDKVTGEVHFGPGQMRVFARTARPIGGVKVATPVVHREPVRETEPIRADIAVTVFDDKGGILSGSIPMHVRVIDPLGATRHELYRATRQGQLSLTLPLAANDPTGTWKVVIRELLANTEGTAEFAYTSPARLRSLAGATHRAVYFGNDIENVFRFARNHRDVTIVKGKSEFNTTAADRLIRDLKPWGIMCKVIDVEKAAKPRVLTEEEAPTWIGLAPGKAKAGEGNAPQQVGFAVTGPVILLGNPADNAIIAYLEKEKFLPYRLSAQRFPGPGRGHVAWQRDGVGHGQESITLIANDAEGMSEAVGTTYEAIAGLEPLTKWAWPKKDEIHAAEKNIGFAAAPVVWSATLPDRVLAMKTDGKGLDVLTLAGTKTTLDANGKPGPVGIIPQKDPNVLVKDMVAPDPAGEKALKEQARPDRIAKLAASNGGMVAVGYWGGTLRIVDGGKVKFEQQLPQDVTALAWYNGHVVAGLADGRVLALKVK